MYCQCCTQQHITAKFVDNTQSVTLTASLLEKGSFQSMLSCSTYMMKICMTSDIKDERANRGANLSVLLP